MSRWDGRRAPGSPLGRGLAPLRAGVDGGRAGAPSRAEPLPAVPQMPAPADPAVIRVQRVVRLPLRDHPEHPARQLPRRVADLPETPTRTLDAVTGRFKIAG